MLSTADPFWKGYEAGFQGGCGECSWWWRGWRRALWWIGWRDGLYDHCFGIDYRACARIPKDKDLP